MKKKTTEKMYEINDHLSLKLKRGRTIVCVNGKGFDQCSRLLLNVSVDYDGEDYVEEIESIDEAAKKLENYLGECILIPPEVEFWGHCSNLQAWYEHNYDTRLLHSNLAFPLLKKLTEAGDLLAKRAFKEEIAKRLYSGYQPVIDYLTNEKFLGYLDEKEVIAALEEVKVKKLFLNCEETPYLRKLLGELRNVEELSVINCEVTKILDSAIKLPFLRSLSLEGFINDCFHYINNECCKKMFNTRYNILCNWFFYKSSNIYNNRRYSNIRKF